MQTVLDEIIEKTAQISDEERDKLIRVLQEQKNNKYRNGKKGYVSPNTIWVRDNSHKYRGLHIALKDGELIATGKTIKEADLKAKEKGVKNPLLHYIPAEDEEVWGGW
ncbi:hypothetical protein BH20ACI1_BH20ACI1_13910 [soil metagenome]